MIPIHKNEPIRQLITIVAKNIAGTMGLDFSAAVILSGLREVFIITISLTSLTGFGAKFLVQASAHAKTVQNMKPNNTFYH